MLQFIGVYGTAALAGGVLIAIVAYALTENGTPYAHGFNVRRRAKAREARFAARAKRLGLARPVRY